MNSALIKFGLARIAFGILFIGVQVSLYSPGTLPMASAAWLPNGNPVCTTVQGEQGPIVVDDAAGGAFIVWEDNRAGTLIYVQRISPSGSPESGWPVNGIPATVGAAGPQYSPVAAVPDAGPLPARAPASGSRTNSTRTSSPMAPGAPSSPGGMIVLATRKYSSSM
jgi:hypothetical protein